MDDKNLIIIQKTILCTYVNRWSETDDQAASTVGIPFPKMADLFVLRVIKRGSGVKNCLLCIIEQLRNVFQVLCRTLEREKEQRADFRHNYRSNLKAR